MRVTDLWQEGRKPTLSFELFPARTEKGAANLEKAIDALVDIGPDFMSVTFGAGGSTRKGSYGLVEKLARDKGVEVLPYLACYGLASDEITAVVKDYECLGIESLLAVRGDPPRELEGFTPHPESLAHASDLLRFLGSRHEALCLGAAGYPEGHVEASSKEGDLEFLRLKVESGASFVLTNYCYDNAFFFDFRERCRERGIDVPIVPGVMPVYSIKMMETLAGICGATITEELRSGIAGLPADDKEALAEFGIDFATRQCRELLEGGVPGIHIYTMDRSRSCVEIVRRLRAEGLL